MMIIKYQPYFAISYKINYVNKMRVAIEFNSYLRNKKKRTIQGKEKEKGKQELHRWKKDVENRKKRKTK